MILNVDFHTVVLCPGRLLRDGGGSAAEDEAFTLVEAAIQDLQSLTVSARGPLFSISSARTQRVWSPSAASAPSP